MNIPTEESLLVQLSNGKSYSKRARSPGSDIEILPASPSPGSAVEAVIVLRSEDDYRVLGTTCRLHILETLGYVLDVISEHPELLLQPNEVWLACETSQVVHAFKDCRDGSICVASKFTFEDSQASSFVQAEQVSSTHLVVVLIWNLVGEKPVVIVPDGQTATRLLQATVIQTIHSSLLP